MKNKSKNALILLASAFTTFQWVHAQQQLDYSRLYWVESMAATGEVVVRTYENSGEYVVQLSDVEPWGEKVGVVSPIEVMYWKEPKYLARDLLAKGYAKLKIESAAAPDLREAQRSAKEAGLGLWAAPEQPLRPAPKVIEVWPLNWETLLKGIAVWGGVSAVIASILFVVRVLIAFARRKRLPLLFLGASSAGKSWLWARIREPEISREELEVIERTDVTSRVASNQPKAMGPYLIRPVYIDTPGGQPGRQLTEMLRRRWLIPRKSVWIILLSTTPQKSVTRKSEEPEKIDLYYVGEQLGYLMLPLGVLGSPKTPKPKLVVLVISKFDLFSDKEPGSQDSEPTKDMLRDVFSKHIARVLEECKRAQVEYRLEFCSSLEGWRTMNINNHIEKALIGR